MRTRIIAAASAVLCLLCTAACSTKLLSPGDKGVIGTKDAVIVAIDKKAYQAWVKAASTDDKVAESQLIVHGQLFTVQPGTQVEVIYDYEYGDYLAFKVKFLDGQHEGAEGFLNAYFVKAKA
jgi:hypothetical protein